MIPSKSMKFYCYGHDYGNSTTTGVVLLANGACQTLTLPSASAPGTLENLARVRSGMGKHFQSPADALKPGEHVLTFNGSERYVGDVAIEQAAGASTRKGDLSRYWSQHSTELLLTTAATMISDPSFGLYVVTGLPIETYNKTNVGLVKRALEGPERTHGFMLNGRSRTVYVQVLQVIMEGMGALVASGNVARMRKGVVDIGGRTTDLAVFNGQEPIAHLTKGRPIGVEDAASKLSDAFEHVYGRPLSYQERRDLLFAHAAILKTLQDRGELSSGLSFAQRNEILLSHIEEIAYPQLFAGIWVNKADLVGWVEKALQDVGQEIGSFIAQTWNTSETGKVASDIPIVEVVGGGPYYFAEHLRAIIPHLSIPKEPEKANARGYADLAYELAKVLHEQQATA